MDVADNIAVSLLILLDPFFSFGGFGLDWIHSRNGRSGARRPLQYPSNVASFLYCPSSVREKQKKEDVYSHFVWFIAFSPLSHSTRLFYCFLTAGQLDSSVLADIFDRVGDYSARSLHANRSMSPCIKEEDTLVFAPSITCARCVERCATRFHHLIIDDPFLVFVQENQSPIIIIIIRHRSVHRKNRTKKMFHYYLLLLALMSSIQLGAGRYYVKASFLSYYPTHTHTMLIYAHRLLTVKKQWNYIDLEKKKFCCVQQMKGKTAYHIFFFLSCPIQLGKYWTWLYIWPTPRYIFTLQQIDTNGSHHIDSASPSTCMKLNFWIVSIMPDGTLLYCWNFFVTILFIFFL